MDMSLRSYRGDHGVHVHDHAQVLFGIDGLLDLDIEGHAEFVDRHQGIVIPAGRWHGSQAESGARVWVLDCAPAAGLERVRRFALPATGAPGRAAPDLLAWLGSAPRRHPRRRLDLEHIGAQVLRALHEEWPTARMAALAFLSAQRFHARWLELTGCTPQAWLRARRLDRAQFHLRAGLPLAAVARRTGYSSASALSYALHRDRGGGARAARRH